MSLAKSCLSVAAVSLILTLLSCASSDGFPVVGEAAAKESNIYSEYYNIAQAYEANKNYSKAIEYYGLCMRSKVLKDSAFYKMARCQALGKDWDSARESFGILLERDPENLNLRISLAYIEAMSGNFNTAEEMYRTLSGENPHDASLLKDYIALLMADGKYELAEEKFYLLKETFPDDEAIPDIRSKIADGLDGVEDLAPAENDSSSNQN
ncbi:MAG: tetratricopeptide repeat protein [Treponema sp.]|nr:tetratricopeptide repeat protein [Treponema sp.]